jgi:hypothetical protein
VRMVHRSCYYQDLVRLGCDSHEGLPSSPSTFGGRIVKCIVPPHMSSRSCRVKNSSFLSTSPGARRRLAVRVSHGDLGKRGLVCIGPSLRFLGRRPLKSTQIGLAYAC